METNSILLIVAVLSAFGSGVALTFGLTHWNDK